MRIEENYTLKNYNTFHLPTKSRWFMEYESEEELVRILKDEYYQESSSFHIGSGSNILFVNDYNGIILHSGIRGTHIEEETGEHIYLRAGAGEKWDDIVRLAVSKGWGGIENLSLIPSEAGAAAIQNIGAYGVEIGQVIASVEAYNRFTFEKRIFTNEECEYGYRTSYFKNEHNDPHIITHITLKLNKQPVFNIDYKDVHEALANHKTLSLELIRDSIVNIRKRKLPDPDLFGNAGSFFMNPVIPLAHFERLKKKHPDIPSYPAEKGFVKVPAGWLIEQCGLKGHRQGEVGIHEAQALVIVNYGGATGEQIAELAEEVRTAVTHRFDITLTPEVKYIE